MNVPLVVGLFIITVLISFGCKREPEKRERVSSQASLVSSTTRTVVMGSIQMSFDLTTMQQHERMMKMMNLKMKHNPAADRFIMLTLYDKQSKKLIKDAKIAFEILSPDGKMIKKPGTAVQGMGMFHYGAEFKTPGAGLYEVGAAIKIGAQTYRPKVNFQIK